MSRWDRGLLLAGWLLLFGVRGWLYGGLIPFNGFPDELEHLAQVRVAQFWPEIEVGRTDPGRVAAETLAAFKPLAAEFPQPREPHGVQAGLAPTPDRRSLYYRGLGGLLRLAGVGDPLAAWRLARAVSVGLGLGVVALTWLAGRLIWPARLLPAWLGAGLAALLPQFGALSAAVNPDALANLLGAAFFCLWAWVGRAGLSWLRLGLGVALLACLPLAKKTLFFTYPLVLAAGLAAWRRRLARPGLFKKVLAGLIILLAGGLALAAWYPPAAKAFVALFGLPLLRAWRPGFDPQVFRQSGVIDLLIEELRLFDLGFWLHLKSLGLIFFKSFWAYLGYLDLPLGWGWYLGAAGLSLAGLLGWARRGGGPLEPGQRRTLWAFAAGAGLAAGVILLREVVFFPGSLAQGRHLFPALLPLALLWAAGWERLWPRAWGPWPAAVGLLFLWLMDLQTLWGLATPWFYRLYP